MVCFESFKYFIHLIKFWHKFGYNIIWFEDRLDVRFDFFRAKIFTCFNKFGLDANKDHYDGGVDIDHGFGLFKGFLYIYLAVWKKENHGGIEIEIIMKKQNWISWIWKQKWSCNGAMFVTLNSSQLLLNNRFNYILINHY